MRKGSSVQIVNLESRRLTLNVATMQIVLKQRRLPNCRYEGQIRKIYVEEDSKGERGRGGSEKEVLLENFFENHINHSSYICTFNKLHLTA